LRGGKAYIKDQSWSSRSREYGIFVNLSKVEWCDLSATVRLVLFVEAALRDGLQVQIALPVPHARGREQACIAESEENRWHKPLQEIRKRIERRVGARGFLKYIDFESAIFYPHLQLKENQLKIIEDYETTSGDSEEEDFHDLLLKEEATDEENQRTEEFP